MKKLATFTFLALAALTGCKDLAVVSAPDDFAELERGEHHDYRATNASGVVIAVRNEPNDPKGSLDFWSRALDNKLQRTGYKRVGAEPITTSEGLSGKHLRYEVQRDGRTTEYWIGVFVTAEDVIVVEAGGDTAFFDDATEKRIKEAFRSLRAT
jgi:hypothetical protein